MVSFFSFFFRIFFETAKRILCSFTVSGTERKEKSLQKSKVFRFCRFGKSQRVARRSFHFSTLIFCNPHHCRLLWLAHKTVKLRAKGRKKRSFEYKRQAKKKKKAWRDPHAYYKSLHFSRYYFHHRKPSKTHSQSLTNSNGKEEEETTETLRLLEQQLHRISVQFSFARFGQMRARNGAQAKCSTVFIAIFLRSSLFLFSFGVDNRMTWVT